MGLDFLWAPSLQALIWSSAYVEMYTSQYAAQFDDAIVADFMRVHWKWQNYDDDDVCQRRGGCGRPTRLWVSEVYANVEEVL